MKDYIHLIDWALQRGLTISVYDGEEWPVRQGSERAEILDHVDGVEEAELLLHNFSGQRVAWVRVTAHGVGDDETVCDHSDNALMDEWQVALESAWENQFLPPEPKP